jgi:hypothetical protein
MVEQATAEPAVEQRVALVARMAAVVENRWQVVQVEHRAMGTQGL